MRRTSYAAFDRAPQCASRGSLAQLTAVLWSRRGRAIRRARCSSLECRRDRNLRTSAVDPKRSYAYRENDYRAYLVWLTGLLVIVHLERARNEFRLVTATVGVPYKGCLRHSDCSCMLVDIRIGASSINRIVSRSNWPERHQTAKSCKAPRAPHAC